MNTYLSPIAVIICLFSAGTIEYSYGADYVSTDDILNHYKNELVAMADLDEPEIKEYLTTEHQKSPSVIIADFDGNGKEDIALLTKRISDDALTLRLFLYQKKYEEVKSIDLGVFYGIQCIVAIKKGEVVKPTESIPDLSDIKPVRLSNTGVSFVVWGKVDIAYFWDKDQKDFISIQTSD